MYKGWGQSSVTGQRERSNICLLDVREHLHWWVEESLPPLSNQERRRTAEKDIRPPPPPPPPPPTPDLSRQQPAHTHTAHGLHENILNSIRICKFHELAVLLLNILSGCQINLGCNVWHSEPLFKTETNFSPTNLSLSHSRSDLPVSSPQNLIILEIWGENVTPQDCLLSSGTWREIEKKKKRESAAVPAALWSFTYSILHSHAAQIFPPFPELGSRSSNHSVFRSNVVPTRKTRCIIKWFHPIVRINVDNKSMKPVNVFNKMSGDFPAMFVAIKQDVFGEISGHIPFVSLAAKVRVFNEILSQFSARKLDVFNKELGNFPAVCVNKTRYFYWDVHSLKSKAGYF